MKFAVFIFTVLFSLATNLVGQVRTDNEPPSYEEFSNDLVFVFKTQNGTFVIAKANQNEANAHSSFLNSNFNESAILYERALEEHEVTRQLCESECNELMAYLYYRLGLCYRELDRNPEAISAFTQSIELIKESQDTSFVVRYMSDLDESGNPFVSQLYMPWKEDHSSVYFSRGLTKMSLGDKYGAENDFTQAVSLINYRYNYYEAFGYLRLTQEKYKESISLLNKAIDLEEKASRAYYYRGVAKLKLSNREGCADLSRAGELGLSDAYELIQKDCQ